jgi:hypothetical protein
MLDLIHCYWFLWYFGWLVVQVSWYCTRKKYFIKWDRGIWWTRYAKLLCLGHDKFFFCACCIEVVVMKMFCNCCAIRKSWFARKVALAFVVINHLCYLFHIMIIDVCMLFALASVMPMLKNMAWAKFRMSTISWHIMV